MSKKRTRTKPRSPRQFKREEGEPRKQIPLPDPLFARLWAAAARLGKYADDLVGLLLASVALITAAGLLGLTSGGLLDVWVEFLQVWLGWGAIIVPATLAWAAGLIFLHNFHHPVQLRWGRVLAVEITLFALLGLLNLAHGGSVARAANGEGGGLIGWGLGHVVARVFAPADAFILGFVFLIALFFSLDITSRRLGRLWEWARAQDFTGEVRQLSLPDPEASAELARPLPAAERRPARPKLARGERLRIPVASAADEVRVKARKRDRRLPGLDLLDDTDLRRPAQKEIDETASLIVKTLKEFGVPVNVSGARVGPSVTQYQVEPGFTEKAGVDGVSRQWKVRVAQIAGLHDDLALALSASALRIEAPVPGQSYVGIEVPHRRANLVGVRAVMEAEAFQSLNSPLAITLGRDVSGAAIAADLVKMPHLLIAGTTGSGKSVCIAALVTCLITNNTPDDLRLVLIDPKMVELVRFNGLPHLFGKVETELERILGVLRWTVREMDRRYRLFEQAGVRNLDHYYAKTAKKKDAERLPRIVVMIDELADLMMQAPDETERSVVRLAQMARATGIHLVVATQRPSTDVVTGLIKANFPARISFAVTSGIDSRVILDQPGAETLLGRGDMLFLLPENGTPQRLQGCFVSDRELERVVGYWREQADDYAEELAADDQVSVQADEAPLAPAAPWDEMLAREAVVEDKDRQIEQAIDVVKKYGTASASLLQRKMRIGYPRAARLMDELKQMGIVGREQAGGRTREVFVRPDDDPIGQRAARILGGEGDDD